MELSHLPAGTLMRRFFIERSAIAEGVATIEGELFRHLVAVLRLRPGARLILADGEGGEYGGVLDSVAEGRALVRIEERVAAATAGRSLPITLLQGLPKGEKMELILQKGTELGAARFVPVLTARAVPRLAGDRAAARVGRWERIVREAARQCRRPDIPAVGEIVPLAGALAACREELKLLLWEEESEQGVRELLESVPPPASVAILVGPEGGLSAEEAAQAAAAGFIPVSLGPRILRTETAGLALLAILQYVWGDLGIR